MYFCSYEFRYIEGSVKEEILESLLNIDFNCFSPRGIFIFFNNSTKRDGNGNLGQTIEANKVVVGI